MYNIIFAHNTPSVQKKLEEKPIISQIKPSYHAWKTILIALPLIRLVISHKPVSICDTDRQLIKMLRNWINAEIRVISDACWECAIFRMRIMITMHISIFITNMSSSSFIFYWNQNVSLYLVNYLIFYPCCWPSIFFLENVKKSASLVPSNFARNSCAP